MNRLALLGLGLVMVSAPALAQPMADMPGMSMPAAKTPTKPHAKIRSRPRAAGALKAARPAAPIDQDMSGMPMPAATPSGGANDMSGMKGMDMSSPAQGAAAPGQSMAAMPEMSEPAVPNTAPPPAPTDHAADRFYDPAAMATARATLRQEHGGAAHSMVLANLAEYQAGAGGGGYRWDGEAWFGGDINRLVVSSEGEGNRRNGLDGAELQALYSRAITPYFDLHAGVRQDFAPRGRTYATVGFQGMTPYWFDVQGALFLSTQGELLARLESTYDLRLTQRLILQPRLELNFAAQDTRATQTGSGLSNAELGLRLRYEIRREFAPYVGVSYDEKLGKTADYARTRGEGIGGTTFVAGVRAWF